MHLPAVVLQGPHGGIDALADEAGERIGLIVCEQVFLQPLHSAKPAHTNRASHGLEHRLARSTSLMKLEANSVGEVSVATGTLICL